MSNKAVLTPAYILHHRNYSESSLLLDVFAREYGRVNLIAKGARRNKKQQATAFNLYQPYLLSWTGKAELNTLTDIDQHGMAIQPSPLQVYSGFYMNELIIHLLHKHEPHVELYDAYHSTLKALHRNEPAECVLRYLEKSLLQSLGYGLVLDAEPITGVVIDAAKSYFYAYELGPISGYDKSAKKSGIRVSGSTLLELEREQLQNPGAISEAKQLLRNILARHLGKKRLASRDLYQAYRQFGAKLS